MIDGRRKVSGVREILKPNFTSDAEGDLAVLVLSSVYIYSDINHKPVNIIAQSEVDYSSLQHGYVIFLFIYLSFIT